MAIRHRAVKSTLDRGYASEWNDDHITDLTEKIEIYTLLPTAFLAAVWDTAQTSGGTAPSVQLVGASGQGHPFVVFNTGGTTGNTSSMRKKLAGAVGNITSPADLPILTFSLQIVQVHTSGKVVEAGLLNSSDALFTDNVSGAYFRINNNTLYAVTGDGANETATSIGSFNEYGVYRIEILSSSVKFYVDDMVTPKATHTTNMPSTNLTAKLSIQSQNNVDSTMRLDGIALQILRKH